MENGDFVQINIANCQYYSNQASCLYSSDVSCTWNQRAQNCEKPKRWKSEPDNGQTEIETETNQVVKTKTTTLLANTSNIVFDSLSWYKASTFDRLSEKETPEYSHTYTPTTNRAQLILYRETGENSYILDFNIRNQTVKRVEFNLIESSAGARGFRVNDIENKEELIGTSIIGTLAACMFGMFILIIIFALIIRYRSRKNSDYYARTNTCYNSDDNQSKQASILDSEASFCLQVQNNKISKIRLPNAAGEPYTRDTFLENYQKEESQNEVFEDKALMGNIVDINTLTERSACDGESFKSDYMSCSSSKLSEDSQDNLKFESTNKEEAIIVFPDGTMGRLKTNKLKLLKVNIFFKRFQI